MSELKIYVWREPDGSGWSASAGIDPTWWVSADDDPAAEKAIFQTPQEAAEAGEAAERAAHRRMNRRHYGDDWTTGWRLTRRQAGAVVCLSPLVSASSRS